MKKLLDKIPWQIKGLSLFLFVVWLLWTAWNLSRV
ncbi:uncharacterized protein METZ01_LOCUS213099 [marine metagenome]|uniref:Uncharacterized protein n=1 Tax=marine metagenome TaxID=408172 RepID=A0A382FC36_9ZZZZ